MGRYSRSPSPRRRRSPSPARHREHSQYDRRPRRHDDDRTRKSPSPHDRRRRSPSPGRDGPPRRRSPDYRPDYRSNGPPRDWQGGPSGPPGPPGPPAWNRGPPRGPPGPRRGGYEDEVSDEDCKAGDFMEYRRLKRIKLRKRNIGSIWRHSPTPSPSPEREPPKSKKEAANGTKAGGVHRHSSEEEAATTVGSDGSDSEREDGGRGKERGDRKRGRGKGDEGVDGDVENGDVAAEAGPAEGEEGAAEGEEAGPREHVDLELQEAEVAMFSEWLEVQRQAAEAAAKLRAQQEEEDMIVGPVLPQAESRQAPTNYGGALLPGEGEAMAAFVQSGKRIPRRGEVGLTSEQIEKYENLGYVMSGSRHSRMNAIRIRKENQVYSAEEKAALAMYSYEENKRKETKILEDMKRLVDRTLGTEGPHADD